MRGAWERIGPFRLAAVVLVVFGILSLVLEVQSPSFAMFDGIKVHGSTLDGSTDYNFRGQHYMIIDKIDESKTRHSSNVYLSRSDPTDPSKAYIGQGAVWWIDVVTTAGPFIAAIALLVIGLLRDRRRRAAFADRIGLPGSGIPDDFVARQIRLRRSPPQPPRH